MSEGGAKPAESGRIVKLNVGGVHYDTSIETLTIDPDSMLASLVSGRIPTTTGLMMAHIYTLPHIMATCM